MSFNELIRTLWKNRIPLILITVIGAVVSIIVSLMIQEKYRSTVVMFPAETSSISNALLSANASSKQDIMKFGQEEEAEQLLQLLHSEKIFNRIAEKYALMEHYNISQDGPHPRTILKEKYDSRVNFQRTQYGSVKVEVLDHSPDTAAMIANDIASLVDSVKNSMQNARAKEALNIVRREYKKLQEEVRATEDSMMVLREKGVHEYETQAEMFGEQLAIAIRNGNARAVKAIKAKFDTLSKYGGTYMSLKETLGEVLVQLASLRNQYQKAKADANSTISHKFIVDKAYPADKKAYPIRWVIVVVSTVSAFLLAAFLVIAKKKILPVIRGEE